jgi:ubiquinone/menaquinone biosynthesis C-methylase UbiE
MTTATVKEQGESFWDRIALKYAKKPIADLDAYETKLVLVRSELKATDRVLEIGCGTGTTALNLAPCVRHYTGTDLSHAMIAIAENKLTCDSPQNITFQQGKATDRVDGRPFDAVFAFSLLHLVDDVSSVLMRIRENLKPGGLFIAKTECLKDRSRFLRALVPLLTAVGIAPKVLSLSSEDMHEYLTDAGFEIEQTLFFGKQTTSPVMVARRV